MEFIPFILVLVILAVLVLPIAAIVTANSRASALRREMGYLEERMRGMEAQLARLERRAETHVGASAGPVAAQETAAEATAGPAAVATGTGQVELRRAPEHVPVTPEPVMQTASTQAFQPPATIAAPSGAPVAVQTPQFRTLREVGRSDAGSDGQSLESRIGSQWFNRVGILAVLIGVAWFLKLAFDNHWIGPLGRVMIGLLAGAGLIAWSERFHKRGFAIFSYSLKAIGSGTLYLSLWAAFQLYALMPAGAAFAAMIAVTAFNGYMAWAQDAELLALYAIAGGLSTPLLVSTGGNHEVTLFTYLLMLDLAVLALTALKPWSRLLFVAFTGTVVFVFGWWQGYYSTDQATTTALFVCCFFLPFALAPRLIRIARDGIAANETAPGDISQSGNASFQGSSFQGWNGLVLFLLPVANAALGFLAFYAMLSVAGNEWAPPWLAVGFAAFYLLLMRLPEGAMPRASAGALAALHLTIAIVFLTIAIPLKTHGRWLTIGWLVEGAVLLWLSRRLKSTLLRTFALISTILGLGALVTVNPPAANTAIFNERFGTYCVAIAVCGFIAWLARTAHDEEEPEGAMNWPVLAAAAVLAVNVLILIAVSLEIHAFWWAQEMQGRMGYRYSRDYWMYTQFSYSAFFMLFGGALLTIGFLKRTAFLRWQALILLAATVAKVFLLDMSELGSGLRIVSFIGLGVLLLCVSYVYQRDWLNLRGQKDNQ